MVTFSALGLLSILLVFLLVHICVLLKIIPYNIVWGGRLKTDRQMFRFEIFSIILTLFFVAIVLSKMGVLEILPYKYLSHIFWIMSAMAGLNIVGNLSSLSKWERYIFTPLAMLNLIFCIILALH